MEWSNLLDPALSHCGIGFVIVIVLVSGVWYKYAYKPLSTKMTENRKFLEHVIKELLPKEKNGRDE